MCVLWVCIVALSLPVETHYFQFIKNLDSRLLISSASFFGVYGTHFDVYLGTFNWSENTFIQLMLYFLVCWIHIYKHNIQIDHERREQNKIHFVIVWQNNIKLQKMLCYRITSQITLFRLASWDSWVHSVSLSIFQHLLLFRSIKMLCPFNKYIVYTSKPILFRMNLTFYRLSWIQIKHFYEPITKYIYTHIYCTRIVCSVRDFWLTWWLIYAMHTSWTKYRQINNTKQPNVFIDDRKKPVYQIDDLFCLHNTELAIDVLIY